MRILVTGANGFIARHLIAVAEAQGHTVHRLARAGTSTEQTFAWSLGKPAPRAAVDGVNCAIHLAHDFSGTAGANLTMAGTVALASQLQAAGITRQLFFSSYSAGVQASSLYGITKHTLEKALADYHGLVIVRPGLVLGEGGIYGRIRRWARHLPCVPLPNGGNDLVPVITIEKLCRLTLQLAAIARPPREANLFEPQLVSLRELVLKAAAEANRRPLILPVPSRLLRLVLQVTAATKLPLPVNADNLAGFLANQSAQHTSYLGGEQPWQ
jgi:nucleoside-diphosphate-sugar epimerase